MTSIIKICMKDGNRKSFFCRYQQNLKISLAEEHRMTESIKSFKVLIHSLRK